MSKKINKKKIFSAVRAVVFILIFVLVLNILNPIFIPKENTREAGIRYYPQKVFYGEQVNTIDVVCLGNSDMYRSIIPLQLYKDYGYAAFDTAMASARTVDLYYMLKDILTRQTPRLVIFETDCLYRDAPDEEKMSSWLKSSATYLLDGISATDEDLCGELYNVFPVIGYHSRWKSLTKADFTEKPDYTKRVDPNKGYLIDAGIKPYTGGEYMKETTDVDVIQPAIALYMDKIVQLCRDNNIELLLYESPAAHSWNYQRHNGVVQYAEKNNLTFVDYNLMLDEIGIDWATDTKDKGEHMNIYGGTKCTTYMGKYLSEHYDLPDRRGEDTYASWKNDLKSFSSAVASAEKKAGKSNSKAS
ncbi:MAG TPA: hypothetical protein GX401_05885 [Clostridiales bacterium]|nr:hypothetical protein [Clostridiales bacterium]